ncbi:MAG: HlyD family efflux transporter periplasmic adaptor subunit [Candidatus Aureabacteria bacterium]|nr:HlyD family efflux transporter periplasmic adaptor subunit [Candidatus Auribacterota bacterium]
MKKFYLALIFLSLGYFFLLLQPHAPAMREKMGATPLSAIKPVKIFSEQPGSLFVLRKRDLQGTLEETGTVVYHHLLQIHTETGGDLSVRHVRIGDHVIEGQILFTLENPSLRQELDALNLRLREARVARDQFYRFTLPEARGLREMESCRYRRELEELEEKVKHNDILFRRGMISEKEFSQAKEEWQLKDMTRELFDLKTKKEEENLNEQEKKIRENILRLEEDLAKLEQSVSALQVRALMTGKVVEISERLPKDWSESNLVSLAKGEWLVTLASEKQKDVQVFLFEKDMPFIGKGDTVCLKKSGFENGSELQAVISHVSSVAAPYGEHWRFEVRLQVEEDLSQSLIAGEKVLCVFNKGMRRNIYAIPLEYLFYDGGKKVCYRHEETGIRPVPVQTGMDNGEWIEISGDLKEGQHLTKRF